MNKIYKWGIIGPGRIADKFAAALLNVPNAKLHAVASRDIARATQFAGKHNAPKMYGSYEALAIDKEVDAVYIATPHTFHLSHAIRCLENRKPVLCEKPMSVNYKSTLEIVLAARNNDTFLMEGMWTRFLPLIDKTLQLINEGEIGEVKHVRADFGFVVPFDPNSRLYDMKLGGGSLLDVGVYPLFLALLILGKPGTIKSFAHLSATGSDETMNAILSCRGGCSANIFSSVVTQTPLTAEIYGTKGIITLQRPWYKGTIVEVRKGDTYTNSFSLPFSDNGFEFEILEVHNCLERGLKESSQLPLDFSLMMSEAVDTICRQNNIIY